MKMTTESVESILDKLSGSALAKFNRSAVQYAAWHLKEDAKKTFEQELPKADSPNPKYSDVLLDAIRQGSNTSNESDEYTGRAKVHVMGTRNPSSMTFIARFFEAGTRQRGTEQSYRRSDGRKRKLSAKSMGNRGRIKPLGFLYKTSAGWSMDIDIEERLSKYIQEIQKS